MIFKLSQKLLSNILELTRKYKIKMIPTMFLNTFPPRYSEMSIMSEPAKFFINLTIR